MVRRVAGLGGWGWRSVSRWVPLILVLAGCSSDGGTPLAPDPPDPDSTGNPDARLECDRVGYPCSVAGVSAALLGQTQLLADSAAALMAGGMAPAGVRSWLSERDGVAEVQGDDHALRFRLAGAVPVWVFDDGTAATEGGRGQVGILPPPAHRDVVGGETPEKRALVLSPFAWQFGVYDEGPGVSTILGNTRGYAGGVEYRQVATQTGPPLPLDAYRGWANYDVVHVSTHGATICDEHGCRATMSVAIDNRDFEEVAATWHGTGVTFSVGSTSGNRYVNLEADFFLEHYTEGMGNTLVYLSACETLQGSTTDLADAIRGNEGVFLGWSAPVASAHARNAALAFYARLSEAGVTAGTAYDDLGDLKSGQWVNGQGHTVTAFLRITTRQAGGDLRLRDIPWLEHPDGGGPMEDGAHVAIHGTLGDGRADSLPYRIRVDGVDAPPASFAVRVQVDGVGAPARTLTEAEADGEMSWILTGVAPMGRDLVEDETLTMRVTIELPDGGTSSSSVDVIPLDDPGYWVGRAAHRRATEDTNEIIEAINMRFDYNAETGRYELTSGTLMWSARGSTFNAQGQVCTYNLPPTPVPAPPGSAFLQIHPGSSPARYTVYGNYEGEQFSIATSCSNLQLPMKFHAVWMRTGTGTHVVSDDGNAINGGWAQDWGFLFEAWGWELERRRLR